jgi:hypothetical protein
VSEHRVGGLPESRHVDWWYEGAFLVAVLAGATLCLTLVGRRSGWSIGQLPADPILVQIYAAHFRHGDLLPVWSSSDAFGMGSPVTLYYHRVFFMVGGLIFIVLGGSLKATMVVTLALFMVVGAYGMRTVLGVVTQFRWLRSVGSIGFLFTNWAFTEWLVRGDLAEFAALMFVPWLLYCCLTLVKDGRLSWLIIPAIVLVVESHSAIGLVSLVILAATGVVFVVTKGPAGLRSVAPRLVLAAGATAVILLPLLVAEFRMGRYYDPITVIETASFSANFARPLSYLFDPSYHWLSRTNTEALPVQLDLPITALLVVGVVTTVCVWATRSRHQTNSAQPHIDRPVAVLLVSSLVAYMLLQFRFTLPLYDAVSVVKVIDYPYRMMSFVVPLALILAVMVADWYLRAFRARWPQGSPLIPAGLAGAWLASLVLLSPVTAHEPPPLKDSFLPDTPFLSIADLTPSPSGETPLFWEYLPKVDLSNGQPSRYDINLYDSLHATHKEAGSLSTVPCAVVETSGMALESLRASYEVTCAGPTLVALPISYNPFTTVTELAPAMSPRPVTVLHVVTDPRIVIRVDGSGLHRFAVQLPTLAGILFGH